MDCRLYLPENNTLRHVIIAISENMKIVDRDGNEMDKPFGHNRDKQWRNLTQRRYHFFFILELSALAGAWACVRIH